MKTLKGILNSSNDKIGKIHFLGHYTLFAVTFFFIIFSLFSSASSSDESVGGWYVILSPLILVIFAGAPAICYMLAEKNLAKRNKGYLVAELLVGVLSIPSVFMFTEAISFPVIIYSVVMAGISGVVLYDILKNN